MRRSLCLTLLAAINVLPLGVNAESCIPIAKWSTTDANRSVISISDLINRVARHRVVLLGEIHDNPQHHAWQLHSLAALHARQPTMMIGFEGFPRRVQPTLDRWVSGSLSESEFLREVEWDRIWAMDPQLYLPLFHFARMHRIPMLALNVDRELVQQVSEKGWSGILPSDRQGVGDPVPATQAYLQVLYPAFRAHSTDQAKTDATDNPLDDPRFRKFVDGMLLWDRAMAEAIANPLLTKRTELVVGIVGRGHVEHRHGIPRQLESLGMGDVTVLLPWDVEEGCASPPTGIATAVFGLDARAMVSTGPRLGIELEEVSGQVKIRNVMDNSIAQKAGLLAGDVIVSLAGISVSSSGTVVSAVKRQAPGTWLPITIARNGGTHELIAKFPSKP